MGIHWLYACGSDQAAASAPVASAAERTAEPGAAAAHAHPVAGPSAPAQGAPAHPVPTVRGAPGEPSGRILGETSSGAPCSPDHQETVQLSSRAACQAAAGAACNPNSNPVPRAAPLPLQRRRPLADLGADRLPPLAGGSAAGSGIREGVRVVAGAAPGLPRPQDDDPDETVPLVNGGLAQRALRGRQSIAPGGVREPRPLMAACC